jgi:hypothetical protein
MKLKLNKDKINGILPQYVSDIDVKISCSQEKQDSGEILANQGAGAWYIISQDNKLYYLWRGFNILCCLLSSYYYAYMAAFVAPKWGERNFFIMLGFEFIFLMSMGFKFLCEFVKDGAVTPTRDLKQIAERYLRGDFISDLIPLIPFPLILTLEKGRQSHFYIIKCIRLFNGFMIFDIQKISILMSRFNILRLDGIIRRDPVQAENKLLN